MTSKAELEQRHLTRLTAFVLRARRVKAHSLYEDFEALERVPESLNGDLGPEWRRLTIPNPGEPTKSMFPTDPDAATSVPD